MPVHVRSSFSQKEGTWIVPEGEDMEQAIIAGVAHDRFDTDFEADADQVEVADEMLESAPAAQP